MMICLQGKPTLHWLTGNLQENDSAVIAMLKEILAITQTLK
jgi:hypothetical protein